ncbi:MAG TPA: hypothetical protein VMM76_04830 [Pirellulaceae bacterium]|nr:hypothetical protein [Pirellulaceae bacterium]
MRFELERDGIRLRFDKIQTFVPVAISLTVTPRDGNNEVEARFTVNDGRVRKLQGRVVEDRAAGKRQRFQIDFPGTYSGTFYFFKRACG